MYAVYKVLRTLARESGKATLTRLAQKFDVAFDWRLLRVSRAPNPTHFQAVQDSKIPVELPSLVRSALLARR